ncbi:MAG: hypothetical protein V4617_07935 [Gemmatimonadota bacterium]
MPYTDATTGYCRIIIMGAPMIDQCVVIAPGAVNGARLVNHVVCLMSQATRAVR